MSVVATHDFDRLEADAQPDVFITPSARIRAGCIRPGQWVRRVSFDVVQPQTFHDLALRNELAEEPVVSEFREWVLSQS